MDNGKTPPLGGRPSVVLISAPGFAHGWVPLNVARLKAALTSHGFAARTLSLCVEFSDYLARRQPTLVSLDQEIGEFGQSWHELYYSSLLFAHATPQGLIREALRKRYLNQDLYRTELDPDNESPTEPRRATLEAATRRVMRYCTLMREFLRGRIRAIDWEQVAVVGFSCVEAQFLTSVFLARELKTMQPALRVVFGGPLFQPYNAEAILTSFREIDHLVVGEGESALATVLRCLESGEPAPRLLGRLAAPFSADPIGRGTERLRPLPPPDYDDVPPRVRARYSLTTYVGKGCSHWRCSFCGISERGQEVRPAEAVFAEISHLVKVYGTRSINFGDWEINGSPEQLERLCDYLIGAGIRLDSWAELNARNTSPRLLHKMQTAGITSVQIGVESFSPAVLRSIRKPATLLDNVKVLKWGIEEGMQGVLFNILCNHPKSTPDDARSTLRVLRAIAHLLRPPVELILNEMELYRTSDLFERAEHYGISDVGDYEFYRNCYPAGHLRVRIPMFNLSYRKDTVDPLWQRIRRYLERLRRSPVTLTMRRVGDTVKIYDSRRRRPVRYDLKPLDGSVLEATADCVCTSSDVARQVGEKIDTVEAGLARLLRVDLVLQDRGRYLALPVRKRRHAGEAGASPTPKAPTSVLAEAAHT